MSWERACGDRTKQKLNQIQDARKTNESFKKQVRKVLIESLRKALKVKEPLNRDNLTYIKETLDVLFECTNSDALRTIVNELVEQLFKKCFKLSFVKVIEYIPFILDLDPNPNQENETQWWKNEDMWKCISDSNSDNKKLYKEMRSIITYVTSYTSFKEGIVGCINECKNKCQVESQGIETLSRNSRLKDYKHNKDFVLKGILIGNIDKKTEDGDKYKLILLKGSDDDKIKIWCYTQELWNEINNLEMQKELTIGPLYKVKRGYVKCRRDTKFKVFS